MGINYKWQETFIWIPAFVCYSMRVVGSDPWYWITPGIVTMIAFLFYFKFQLYLSVFKRVITTFRSLVMITSLIIVIICDITRTSKNYSNDTILWITTAMDDVIYCVLVGCYLAIDSCEKITNFTRIFGPAILIAVSLQNLYNCHIQSTGWENYIIFTHRGRHITLMAVESGAIVQIIIFCISFVWAVFRDWDHKNFFILKDKIPRRKSLINKTTKLIRAKTNISQLGSPLLNTKYSGSNQEYSKTKTVDSSWESMSKDDQFNMKLYVRNTICYIIFVIIGIIESIFFFFDINTLIFVSCLTFVFLLTVLYLLRYNLHFEVATSEILRQFRVWILTLSVVAILFCAAYDLYLDYTDNGYKWLDTDWCGFLETFTYCLTVILGILRDGLVYPLTFHLILPSLVLIPTYYSIYATLFVWNQPYWYLYIQRTAFIQVALLQQLILWSVYKDPKHCFFTLILKRKSRCNSFKTSDSRVMAVIDINTTTTMQMTTVSGTNKYHGAIQKYDIEEILWSDREQTPVSVSDSLSNDSDE